MRRFVSALTCALVLVGAFSVATAPPGAAATSRAVVIVQTDAQTYVRTISFSGTISGVDALQLAGANPALYGFSGPGVAVCKLFGVGNDPTEDTCLGTPSDPRYWAYFRAPGGAGAWTYSRAGAGSTTVSDGDVEGWRFGTGQAPPFSSFCDVVGCAPPPTSPPAVVPPGGGSSSGGERSAPAPGGSATPAAPGTATPGSTTSEGVPEPVVTTQLAPVVTTTEPVTDGRRGQALGVRVPGGPDDGSGSPWGLIVAGGVAVGVVAAAVLRRRRRSAA